MKVVEWNTTTPNQWQRSRIKYLCRFVGGGTPDKSNMEFWNGDIPWVSPKDMKSPIIVDTEDHLTAEGLAASAAKLVEPGAVLIVMRSGILRHTIPVAINAVPATVNQDMRALLPNERLSAKYLARLIEGHQQQLLNKWSKEGTTVESLESELVADTEIALPPLPEQHAIAAFLDRETARIDELIAEKEKLIALIAEKRRALVAHAVTRGLDPNAPMSDSGIPWLGEIPAHWGVERLRWLTHTIEQGWSPEAESRQPEPSEWGVLKLNAVARGAFDPTAAKALPADTDPIANLEVKCGDFLITRSNTPALVGDVCVVHHTRPYLMICDLIYRLRLRVELINGDYLCQYLLTNIGRVQIQSDARGTSNTMVKISQEHIKDWATPLPPMDEQRAIAAHISSETSKLDLLHTSAQQTLELLKERRAALIAAAVTGEIQIE